MVRIRPMAALIFAADSPAGRVSEAINDLTRHLADPGVHAAQLRLGDVVPPELHSRLWPPVLPERRSGRPKPLMRRTIVDESGQGRTTAKTSCRLTTDSSSHRPASMRPGRACRVRSVNRWKRRTCGRSGPVRSRAPPTPSRAAHHHRGRPPAAMYRATASQACLSRLCERSAGGRGGGASVCRVGREPRGGTRPVAGSRSEPRCGDRSSAGVSCRAVSLQLFAGTAAHSQGGLVEERAVQMSPGTRLV